MKSLIKRLTRTYISETFRAYMYSLEIPSHSQEMPRWRSILSFREPFKIIKPGFYMDGFRLKYRPFTDFFLHKEVIVRNPCNVVVLEKTPNTLMLKDSNGDLYFYEHMMVHQTIKKGAYLASGSYLGETSNQTLRVTYYSSQDEMILPITKCLLDL